MEQYAKLKMNHCLVISDVVETAELINQIHEARKISLSNNPVDSSLLAWSYELEADIYVNKNEYLQAIEFLNYALEIHQQMITTQDENSHFMSAQTYITIAWCYAMLKQNNTADQYYAQWKEHAALSTHVLSMQLYNTLMEYYKIRGGMLTEATNLFFAHENEFNSVDSMSLATYAIKYQLSELYRMNGDYKSALKYQLEASTISDTLTRRANYAIGSEMAAIYELSEKQKQIEKQESEIRIRSSYIAFLSILFLLSSIFALILWRNYQKRTRKNHILFRQIQKLSRLNREFEEIRRQMTSTAKPLSTSEPNTLDTSESDDNKEATESDDMNLYLKIANCMQQNKLFLNPKLTREDLAAELGTNKTYISNTIRHQYDQTFTEYLNNLRLEYAKELLTTDNQIKIEVVALMSGFNSVRTFYRIFHNSYGVTPNECRNINNEQD
ncbi:MAG: helix-turn-helix transcriptional regulator [Mucinivorans sp.]